MQAVNRHHPGRHGTVYCAPVDPRFSARRPGAPVSRPATDRACAVRFASKARSTSSTSGRSGNGGGVPTPTTVIFPDPATHETPPRDRTSLLLERAPSAKDQALSREIRAPPAPSTGIRIYGIGTSDSCRAHAPPPSLDTPDYVSGVPDDLKPPPNRAATRTPSESMSG
jgi:hypothetical protein